MPLASPQLLPEIRDFIQHPNAVFLVRKGLGGAEFDFNRENVSRFACIHIKTTELIRLRINKRCAGKFEIVKTHYGS